MLCLRSISSVIDCAVLGCERAEMTMDLFKVHSPSGSCLMYNPCSVRKQNELYSVPLVLNISDCSSVKTSLYIDHKIEQGTFV